MRYHHCPGCQDTDVPDTMLSCLPCWRSLPNPIKDEVQATRRLNILAPRRREALTAAMREFRLRQA